MNYSEQYIDTQAIGPVQDYQTVGEEEDIFRLESKLRVHFGNNEVVSQLQEPRYTPSLTIQATLAELFAKLISMPKLENMDPVYQTSGYRGVELLEPFRTITPPSLGAFMPRTTNTAQPTLFQSASRAHMARSRARIYQGVVNYWDSEGIFSTFIDPGQLLEERILQILAAHGAAQLLELSDLATAGFTKTQIATILALPPEWIKK